MALHPLTTTRALHNSYIRYLKTIKPFQDDELRREFAESLGKPGALMKGPIVEASPPFLPGASLAQLVAEGVLSRGFSRLCNPELPYERPLHLHQEKAIRKAVGGRNIVVATGTGSGKTETFLIPIFDYLLREEAQGTLKRPGVRALLLYPMNALANDQVKRLRRILEHYPSITFGRYVGETEEKEHEAHKAFEKNYPEEKDIPNELKSRQRIQAEPPHILLTNYAMLEYLLLRPNDSTLFDGDTGQFWRFVVLDETHVYSGANAIEIAMLLRRLQDRVVQGKPRKLQAIATSATLGAGKKDFPAVVSFASDLFNVPFEWDDNDESRQDVIEARRIPVAELGETWGAGTLAFYQQLGEWANIWRETPGLGQQSVRQVIASLREFPPVPLTILEKAQQEAVRQPADALPIFLYHLLRGDHQLQRLRARLEQGPADLSLLADELFDGDEEPIVNLVSAAILARQRRGDAPLLPARYHVFARALEGAFVCLNTDAHNLSRQQPTPRLFLRRHKFCPHCNSCVFELANCTRCGASYLIGDMISGEKLEESGDPQLVEGQSYLIQNSALYDEVAKNLAYFVLDPQASQWDEDEALVSEAEMEDVQAEPDLEKMRLCVECGAIYGEKETRRCKCKSKLSQIFRVETNRARTLRRCVRCSTHSSGGVIYRFLTGQDAPVSVLADSLYQYVPPARKESEQDKPGAGRKMLNFTDSRQNAAFFAAYLERVHQRNLRRQLIMSTIENAVQTNGGNLRLEDLLPRLIRQAETAGLFSETDGYDKRERTAAIWLMQEFSPLDRRISLEGVGLLSFQPVQPRKWDVPDFLTRSPWNMSKEEAYNLIHLLLNTLRWQGVHTFLMSDRVDLLKDEAFAPRQKAFYVRQDRGSANKDRGILGWLPASRSNARVEIVKKWLVSARKLDEKDAVTRAEEILRELWKYLTEVSSPWQKHFVAETVAKEGVLYRLDYRMWELAPKVDVVSGDWHICERCQNISPINLGSICPIYGCTGQLQPLTGEHTALKDNLYRDIYLNGNAIPMRTEEHTAQWVTKKAAEIQNQFISGDVNVLSCSTTFELGVDVGDLQAVVLRNVPPTTANYVQRAGRAGRRTDSAAFVLTFAQRRSHDLTYYEQPEKMVAGQVTPPTVALSNERIIRRHLHSVVMAAFFRWAKDQHNIEYRNVGQFFAPDDREPGPKLLNEFLYQRPGYLASALDRILPSDIDLRNQLAFADWNWVSHLMNANQEGILDRAIDEVTSEIATFAELEQAAADDKKYKQAELFQQVQNQIRRRDLLGFLGSRNVLPKYGFPTDVVELKTDHLTVNDAKSISLDRDLRIAISEFAPGSEVIAAKRLWKSAGIRRLPDRRWPPYEYAICRNCKRLNFEAESLGAYCACGEPLNEGKQGKRTTFIVPEQGFVADSETRSPGEAAPQRIYASRTHFARYKLPDKNGDDNTEVAIAPEELDESLAEGPVQVWKRYSRYGWLAVVNDGMGAGFRVCPYCGYAELANQSLNKRGKKDKTLHKNPLTGRECNGSLSHYHLGHFFMTDVLETTFRLPIRTEGAIYSLLYAILDGASEALGIQRSDIHGAYYYQSSGVPPSLIFYDDVPGGAGHVKRIYNNLHPTLEAALARLNRCECGVETSCYSCLRNYQNQFIHDKLQRGLAIELLKQILGVRSASADPSSA
jgi:ATP-dependent helicase YprA (DUF1998 family)